MPYVYFIITPMGVLHSFSIKNIFHDQMDLKLLYFRMTIYSVNPKHIQTYLLLIKESITRSGSN